MTAPTPQLTHHQAFLDRAAAVGLLSPAQRAKAEAALPSDAATAGLTAQYLVLNGFLTRYQADRLLAGRTDGYVLGQYAIEDQLERGPSGRLYKARHRTMNRPVALKVLASELTRSASARQRIHEGVKAAAQLNHPHVITTYDCNEVGERFYVVLEYVDGPSLQAHVARGGPLPVAEACEFLRQAARGLQHAHERQLIHRNLTPANIFVARPAKGSGGRGVKIAEFGLASHPTLSTAALDQTPAPPAIVPGWAYAAPERIAHPEWADHRADLYSLGAILHFLLTGQAPDSATRIESLRPDVPDAVATIVRDLLARDPADRIATAAQAAERLERMTSAVVAPGEEWSTINFDLPYRSQQADTAASSFLTGIPDSPWAEIVAPTLETASDTLGPDPLVSTPVSLPTMETPARPSGTRRGPHSIAQRGVSSVIMTVIASSMVGLCLLVIGALMRWAAR